ncbi:MAG TPA: flagellar protein FlaG [Sediminispirochaeta sp.]|nr:flagellar protein FlaG [Sediminispirochaeta sp.]
MDIGIHSVQGSYSVVSAAAQQKASAAQELQQKTEERKASAALRQAEQKRQRERNKNVDSYLKDILTITRIFNRKLDFTIDRSSNQVIVKVVDGETDKVIKEIPPEALQRLHRRMQETIGLLFDQEI